MFYSTKKCRYYYDEIIQISSNKCLAYYKEMLEPDNCAELILGHFDLRLLSKNCEWKYNLQYDILRNGLNLKVRPFMLVQFRRHCHRYNKWSWESYFSRSFIKAWVADAHSQYSSIFWQHQAFALHTWQSCSLHKCSLPSNWPSTVYSRSRFRQFRSSRLQMHYSLICPIACFDGFSIALRR